MPCFHRELAHPFQLLRRRWNAKSSHFRKWFHRGKCWWQKQATITAARRKTVTAQSTNPGVCMPLQKHASVRCRAFALFRRQTKCCHWHQIRAAQCADAFAKPCFSLSDSDTATHAGPSEERIPNVKPILILAQGFPRYWFDHACAFTLFGDISRLLQANHRARLNIPLAKPYLVSTSVSDSCLVGSQRPQGRSET